MTGRGQHTLMVVVATGSMFAVTFAGCSDDNPTGTGGAGGTGGTTSVGPGPAPASGPASSSVGTGAGAGPTTNLGTTCLQDDDCDTDMRCMTPSSDSPVLGGGAVGGYCTKDCASNTDCGPGGRCIVPSGTSTGECFQTCLIGPDLMGIDQDLDPMKCHGREDARCSVVNGGEDICIPNCGVDSQCAGRFCDARSGACVDTESMGKGTGELCDDQAPDEDGCAGFCQTFTGDTPSICTQPCVLGGILDGVDCGGGLDSGLCVYRPSGYGPGDFGRCSLACNAHDDCANPAWWCSAVSYATNGFCFTTDDCPQGDPQCAQGEKCTDTIYGPKCLQVDMDDELIFPLGSAAPGTGGAGGAGVGGAGGAGVGGAGVGGAGVGGAGVGGGV